MKYLLPLFLIFISLNSYSQTWQDSYNSATQQFQQGNYSEALKSSLSSVEFAKNEFGETHDNYINSLLLTAKTYETLQQYEEAEKYYLICQEKTEKKHGAKSQEYATVINSYAHLKMTLGHYNVALKKFEKSLEIISKYDNDTANQIKVNTIDNLGRLYENLSDLQKARQYYMQSLQITENIYGKNNLNYANTLNSIARINENLGNYESAEANYTESEKIYEESVGEGNLFFSNLLIDMGRFYFNIGKYEKSEKYYQKSLKVINKISGKVNLYYAGAVAGLAQLYLSLADFEKSEKYVNESLNLYKDLVGENHPYYASNLYNKASLYYFTKRYKEAEPMYKQCLSTYQNLYGKDHWYNGTFLQGLGELYREMGHYKDAENYYNQSIDVYEKSVGKEHPYYAVALNNKAEFFRQTGRYEKVDSIFQDVLLIYENSYGKMHAYYAVALNNLGIFHQDQGHYKLAEKLLLESIEIAEKTKGKNSAEYAIALKNLASLYLEMGKYDETESLFNESLRILDKVLGSDHPDYAGVLVGLGTLYEEKSDLQKSKESYIHSLTIYENNYGQMSQDYANTLAKLSYIYLLEGNQKDAEINLRACLYILQETVGTEHPDYGNIAQMLGQLYFNIGQTDLAYDLYNFQLQTLKNTLGQEHPKYGNVLNAFAEMYLQAGYYYAAHDLYKKAIVIHEKALGKDHRNYINISNNLAVTYMQLDSLEQSKQLLEECSQQIKDKFGEKHPNHIGVYHNLASIYERMKKPKLALEFYNKDLKLSSEFYGKMHQDYLKTLGSTAMLLASINQTKKAIPLIKELNKSVLKKFDQSALYLTETERQALLNNELSYYFSTIYDFSYNYHEQYPELRSLLYNNEIKLKGAFLDNNYRFKNSVLASGNEALIQQYDELITIRHTLGKLYSLPIEERWCSIDSLENLAFSLEKNIISMFPEYEKQVEIQNLKVEDIKAALLPNETAIEFLRYSVELEGDTTSLTKYAALILSNTLEHPKLVHLCSEDSINTLLEGLTVQDLYALENQLLFSADPNAKSKTNLLYKTIWKKIEQELPETQNIYIIPEGSMHKIAFSALPIPGNQYLSDKYNIHILNSSRNILNAKNTYNYSSSSAAIYGGIEYTTDSSRMEQLADNLNRSGEEEQPKSPFILKLRSGSGSAWSYLEGTLKEAEQVESFLKNNESNCLTYRGDEATEESVKDLSKKFKNQSPEVLHFSTHGFFFPDEKVNTSSELNLKISNPNQTSPFKNADNPLLRSGLILAGANLFWTTGEKAENKEDGILTSYEVSNLDLNNTKLVVLSACETGLGEIKGSEGVYGLQRAFALAGADILIMSLWKVPDKETVELMSSFYQKWTSGTELKEAFRQAQAEMREKYHPYYWAAFKLVD